MPERNSEICVAIDGGTTNSRARAVAGGRIIGTGRRNVGVRDAAIANCSEPLRQAIGECIRDAASEAGIAIDRVQLFCASGMLTSNVGLVEVPHVIAPAGIDELARHIVTRSLPDLAPKPIHFVPGIKTLPGAPTLDNLHLCDVMRGEECEAIGVMRLRSTHETVCLLLPGSHTKLLHIDRDQRITASYTAMGGELMQAMAQHTILASSIAWPPPEPPDWPAVDAGGEFALKWGIARGGFAIRLAEIIAQATPHQRAWFFVGLILANEWSELARWPQLKSSTPLFIGGREPLRSAFARLIRGTRHDGVEMLDDSTVETAAAMGAIAITRRHLAIRAAHP